MSSPFRIHFTDENIRSEFEYYNNRPKRMRISEEASACKTIESKKKNTFLYVKSKFTMEKPNIHPPHKRINTKNSQTDSTDSQYETDIANFEPAPLDLEWCRCEPQQLTGNPKWKPPLGATPPHGGPVEYLPPQSTLSMRQSRSDTQFQSKIMLSSIAICGGTFRIINYSQAYFLLGGFDVYALEVIDEFAYRL